MKTKWILYTVFLFLLFFSEEIYASSESLVKVESRPGVAQKFILIKPDKPIAAVILFAGGHGGLRLSSLFGEPAMQWGSKNFLVRTRKLFANHGFMVAVIDAPTDRKKMNAIWRMSQKHAKDILSVIRTLKKIMIYQFGLLEQVWEHFQLLTLQSGLTPKWMGWYLPPR